MAQEHEHKHEHDQDQDQDQDQDHDLTVLQITVEEEVQFIVKLPHGDGDGDGPYIDKLRLTLQDDIPKLRSMDQHFIIYMNEAYGKAWQRKRAYEFQCLICGIMKISPVQMFEHIMQYHVQQRLYKCIIAICNKTFFSNRMLHRHLNQVHYKKKLILAK